MEHTLIVAGIGPGSKEYILPKALSVIEKARYLVGGHRALSDYGHAGQEMYPCLLYTSPSPRDCS